MALEKGTTCVSRVFPEVTVSDRGFATEAQDGSSGKDTSEATRN